MTSIQDRLVVPQSTFLRDVRTDESINELDSN
jgi:hypothetical protein